MPKMKKNNPPKLMMECLENYGPFSTLVSPEGCTINTSDINISNWTQYYDGILNVMRDGIETPFVQNALIGVCFPNIDVELTVPDMFFNIVMWYLVVRTGDVLEPKHLFFDEEITKSSIKNYIDDYFIDVNRKRFSNRELNMIIDDTLAHYRVIDDFAMYFANTINLRDSIDLMAENEIFRDIMHANFDNISIADVKDVGMTMTNTAINIMKNAKNVLGYDHCLADAWRSGESVNPRQYKELAINIGAKPDGQGSVFPAIINKSFINGGVNTPLDYFIESATGRTAQVIAKTNVSKSGSFARLLGLNVMDSVLYPDPDYCCDTQNLLTITIKDKKMLSMYNNRYYKLKMNGPEYLLKAKKDKHLIGQTIYVRSPSTCASAARGHGVCYRCYGDLAYTADGINIGRIASEILSSKLTQRLLSAKHLLETVIEKLEWVKEFYDIYEVEGNIIKLQDELLYKDFNILIDPNEIILENDDDTYYSDDDGDGEKLSNEFNESITSFFIEHIPTGKKIEISNDKNEKLYFSSEFNTVIREKAEPVDGYIVINMSEVKDIPLFSINIQNNELGRTLSHVQNLLNKSKTIKGLTNSMIAQALVEAVIDGSLSITAVHLELLLMNQIRDVDNILEKPDWSIPNVPYVCVTLDKALTMHPSLTICMSYQKLAKNIYNPLTFKKRAPSFMDLFFMEKPQVYVRPDGGNIGVYEDAKPDPVDGMIHPMIFEDESK